MLRAKQPFLFPLHYSKKKKIGSVTSRGNFIIFLVWLLFSEKRPVSDASCSEAPRCDEVNNLVPNMSSPLSLTESVVPRPRLEQTHLLASRQRPAHTPRGGVRSQ